MERDQPATAPQVPGQVRRGPDPWLELEVVVERLARLALNATALSDRMAVQVGRSPTAGQAERLRRLQTGVEQARHGMLAAVRQHVPGAGERRRSERRSSTASG